MGFWEPLIFWVLAIGVFGSSVAMLSFRNPLYSALALIVDFFCFAGLYALLSAHFLAVIQVLVYTGAIMVLFVFIIMLLNLSDEEIGPRRFNLHHILAIVAGGAMFVTVVAAIGGLQPSEARSGADSAENTVERATTVARTLAAEDASDEAEPSDEDPFVTVPSGAVPGLYTRLSEEGVLDKYGEKLRAWESGASSPAAGRYRPYDPERTFEMPPALKQENIDADRAAGGNVEREQGKLFGTVEPIAILLVNRFAVPFELTAVLLLAAIFGAVIIAKKRL